MRAADDNMETARGIDDLDRDRGIPEGRPVEFNAFASPSFPQSIRQDREGSQLGLVRLHLC